MTPMLETLTAFDAAVLGVVLISMMFAFGRGFVTVALSFAAWAGAYFIATVGAAFVQPIGRDYISPPGLADIIVLVGLFFIGLFALKTLADWIGRAVKDSSIGFLDRSLGALFGFLRGAVIISVAFLIFTKFFDRDDEPDWVQNARLRPLVAWSSEMVEFAAQSFIGADGQERGQAFMKRVQDSAKSQFVDEALEEFVPDYAREDRQELDALLDEITDDTDAAANSQNEKDTP